MAVGACECQPHLGNGPAEPEYKAPKPHGGKDIRSTKTPDAAGFGQPGEGRAIRSGLRKRRAALVRRPPLGSLEADADGLSLATVNTFTDGDVLRGLDTINDDRLRALIQLRAEPAIARVVVLNDADE